VFLNCVDYLHFIMVPGICVLSKAIMES
jgi:hypothetical protein